MPVSAPPLIPQPFAESGDRAAIPDTTVATGRASYAEGFPPETMQPKIAGGVPPDGRDMNGILYALSAHALFLQGGQVFNYDAAVSTAIGGYGVGALLESTDGSTLWLNLVDGNTTDPDASGTGWVAISSYGFSAISGLIGGTRTLTRVEAARDTIVLSGTLVANLNLVLPADLRTWRIVNLTTGSFTTTAKLASSVGVTIPQGGYASAVEVYGNGSEIYLNVPPVALPIDVNPTANTLLMRNNNGDGFVRYLNSSPAAESFSIGNVLATNGFDTYLRKISLSGFLTQIFSNAALLGNPTAPTQPGTDNSTRIATTAFVQALVASIIGVGQSWINVTGSRAFNTTYTNTTGKPIQVSISITIDVGSGGSTTTFQVGGTTICSLQGDVVHQGPSLSAIIPAGQTYRLNRGVNAGISVWAELR